MCVVAVVVVNTLSFARQTLSMPRGRPLKLSLWLSVGRPKIELSIYLAKIHACTCVCAV